MKHSELRHQPRHVNPRIQALSRSSGSFNSPKSFSNNEIAAFVYVLRINLNVSICSFVNSFFI